MDGLRAPYVFLLLLASLLLATPAHAQDAAPAPQDATRAAPAPIATCCRVPAGTPVQLQVLDTVNSRTAARGDRVRIRLAAPVAVGDAVVLPAGLDGEAEVIHAERSRGGGKPGELLLAARFLALPGGERVTLKAMTLGGSGKDNGAGAMGVAIVAGPFGMLVRGGELEIAPGTAAQAKLATELAVPTASPAAPVVGAGEAPQVHAGTDPRARGAEAPHPAGTPQ